MTDQALDNMLRQVLLDVDCQQYGDAIDELPECDFSPAFEKKMQKLIRRADHPIRYRVAQAVACLLLAALLSGCTVLAISPEVRAAFVGWVREVSEGWFVYNYTGEAQDTPTDVVYCPTWVPDGYNELKQSISDDHVSITYESVSCHTTHDLSDSKTICNWRRRSGTGTERASQPAQKSRRAGRGTYHSHRLLGSAGGAGTVDIAADCG